MYQAAIVEDDAAILEYLKNTLIQEFDKKGTTVAFDAFTSGTRFLEMYEAVQYPFGYGLSYTNFKQEIESSTMENGTITLNVNVTFVLSPVRITSVFS